MLAAQRGVRRYGTFNVNWEAIGAIGEVVGAVAVVLTLVYLAVQLRQNTNALKTNTWQSIQDAEQRFDEFLSRDHHLLEVWIKGHQDRNSLSESEQLQFFLLNKQLLDQFQTHHYHYEKGMIDEDLWSSWERTFVDDLQKWGGYEQIVRERLPLLRPAFGEFVNKHLPDGAET